MAVVSGMRFTVLADLFAFDSKRFTVETKNAVRQVIKEAAKKWLVEAVSRIPVQTGFLHSAFQNLITELGVSVRGKGSSTKLINRPTYEGRRFQVDRLKSRIKNLQAELRAHEGPRKPRTTAQLKEELKKYKKNKATITEKRRKKLEDARKDVQRVFDENAKQDRKQAIKRARIREAGQIQKVGDERAKLSRAEFKNTKIAEFYARQRAAKLFQKRRMRYKKAVKRYRELIQKLDKQQQSELRDIINQTGKYKTKGNIIQKRQIYNKRFGQTNKRGEKYGYSRRFKLQPVKRKVVKIKEVPNPTYQKEYLDWIRKKKQGPAPQKTIRKQVVEEETVYKRRRISYSEETDLYTKYYYPSRGVKGPLKTPLSGAPFATAPGKIFLEQTVGNIPRQYGETQYGDVKEDVKTRNKTFATVGKGKAFTLKGSANEALRATNQGENFTVAFNYNILVSYYRIMDLFKSYRRGKKTISPAGIPWRSMTNANQAFLTYVQENLPKAIPSFLKFLKKTRIDVSTKGSTVINKPIKF